MHVHGPPSVRRPVTSLLAAPLALASVLGPSLLASSRAQSPLEPREWPEAPALSTVQGEPIPPEMIGETVVESWEDVFARAAREPQSVYDRRQRYGAQGEWVVAGTRRHGEARSGAHYVTNKWGDARMGIGFRRSVDVRGVWVIGQDDASRWPASLVVVGYRDGAEVARSRAFTDFSEEPAWLAIDLAGVDRIELAADPKAGTTGHYGIDDLTFVADGREVVVGFDDLQHGAKLTGSGYAGLDWEAGTGDFEAQVVHAPLSREMRTGSVDDEVPTAGGGGTPPNLVSSFIGPRINDAGGGWIPPDTCGAVGPTHFVTVVNSNFSVYVKSTGARVVNTSLNSFLAGDSSGDPRVTFDKTSQRFVVLATDFSNEISIAISNTSDPTGTWTKAAFNPAGGSDAGKWPDYPTLGVNKDFIVTCAYMVGGSNLMSAFAIDKQNFINTGSLTITAFRGLPWEGAIHGATTWDTTASQYLVSRTGSGLRIRRLNLPANAPTLSELGIASVSTGSNPPNAPQQGGPSVDTLDGRPMNAWWINGSLWTTNCISSGGRAACRWYQVSTSAITVTQSGTVDSGTLHYFMPSIAVNADNEVAMGFSGSNSSQFIATYFTGRLSTDPAGQMGVPVLYKAGEGSYDDGNGPRWGDYSLTSVDPTDDQTFWTIQEYAGAGGGANWRTYIAELEYPGFTDCNNNGIDDSIDISNGTSQDCDGNGVPDECQPDCDGDALPDACEVDCNANGTPDDCEVFGDCNSNGIPDECDPDCDGDDVPDDCESDCNGNGVPDDCEGLQDCDGNGIPDICETFDDCNSNGVPDACEPDCDGDQIPDDCEADCDGNGVPDDCDLVFPDCDGDGVHDGCEADCDGDATPDDCEPDCDGDGTPDDCEGSPDCNQNGVPDECDISSGTSADVNGNGVPDECELVAVDYCFCTTGICGNHDAAAGCANSTGAGALLAASGSGSVSADDLLLTMAPLPTNKFGLFYMGTTTPNTPFGDGYRCVGGSIFRYPVLNSGGTGSISFGPIVGWANSHFSGSGHIVPGATWNFQGWYRDPAGPCGTGFNLTNGTSITFGN